MKYNHFLPYKSFLFLVLFFVFIGNSFSQYEVVRPINNQLRGMFSQITYPDATVEFLYERSANMIDSTLYDHYKEDDTLNTAEWKLIYEEMYFASHDTSLQTPIDSIIDETNQFQNDTVNFGIMHWNFYHLKQVSLQSGNYFTFDIPNNRIYDHPSPVASPYQLDSLFLGAPLSSSAHFKNVTYRINPAFIFRDGKTKTDLKDNYTLQIDFGDGIGLRVINPDVETYIPVTYSTSGEKVIKTVLYPKNGIRSYKYSSVSRIFINSDNIKPVADYEITSVPGMTVGVYNSCQPAKESKKIIYVEGYDFADFFPKGNTTHQSNFSQVIKREQLHHLQNYGYEYYVIDWKDSKKDMRFNAYNLFLLIEKLKRDQAKDGNNQEFVIIGESMGGVIARYVINYMESDKYQNEKVFEVFFSEIYDRDSWPYILLHPRYTSTWRNYINHKERRHNTRLLITLDSPHQGANIPLAYQYLYRLVENKFMPPWLFRFLPTAKFQLLDRKASRQLLKNWAPPIFVNLPFSISSYTSNYSHGTFFNQSKFENDGNPRFCKMVALSDGALDGSPQQDPSTLKNRVNGDYFLDLDYNMDVSVLWIKLNVLSLDIEMRTTPNQSLGRIYKARLGTGIYVPKFKIFGITITKIVVPILYNEKQVNTTTSYDNVAGGNIDLDGEDGIRESIQAVVPRYFKFEIWGGFLGAYNIATAASNGMSFCFVPLESALDYKGAQPFNNDILNAGINDKLARTPFDVFTGQINESDFEFNNLNHINIRNPEVYNLTQTNAVGTSSSSRNRFAFHTCAVERKYAPIRTFLSQEIGDEELYLENFYTDRITSYRPEWDLHVNDRNPYYYYNAPKVSGSLVSRLTGVYSKKNDFNVVNSGIGNGYATFYYDNSSPSPTPGLNINYINASTSQFTSANVPYAVCCATSRSSSANSKLITKPNKEGTLEIFPNPSLKQDLVFIKADLPQGGSVVTVTIYDLMGKQVYLLQASKIENTHKFEQPLNLPKLNLTKGLYLVKVANDKHSISKQLIIQ